MPLLRFRIRTLMIAVAVAGVALGTFIERRTRFLRRAEHHRSQIVAVDYSAPKYAGDCGVPIVDRTDGQGRVLSDQQLRRDDWHRGLAWKYSVAAGHPWLPVPPDPPQPK